MLTRRLRVAVLCSRRAPGLAHLLARLRRDPTAAWDVVCCLSSEQTYDEEPIADTHRVPVIHHSVHRFYTARDPHARFSNLEIRADYDRQTKQLLAEHRPDVILLAGYLLLLTEPMLDAFAGRIINVHHSDLLLRNPSGGPRYPGLRAVRDAILAGERETRSTSHVVTQHLDDGPTLLRSRPFYVPEMLHWARTAGADDVVRKLIWAHQEWMLRSAFGPLMEQTLDLLCEGEPVRAPEYVS